MTGGEVAALLAALAFIVLVIFLCMFIKKLIRNLEEMERTINSISSDVDMLSKQAENVLASSNTLIKDIDDKLNTINPVFDAAAEVGQSVSEFNTATHDFTSKFRNRKKSSLLTRFIPMGRKNKRK
ncbi:DUF948 domain-containing protein [Apilactobacillus xinyiensis]|uniref:DUF948 domain-containing protein n=1 Tax=Apilactobacillus xinyiensis TaxID=2841032 RepID=UPI001C7D7ABA|nr:DUF948 domain-containing protein [Apilactobacillus xinyiensis]MCL0318777.1 DUF948 domain-containing protein [Apilactobacillus xinyiensis]MCL0329982.1 DUF948 domain-containing protein [Apilactobacillus xinyiensis]